MKIHLGTKRASRHGSPVPGGPPAALARPRWGIGGRLRRAFALLWVTLGCALGLGLWGAPALAAYKVQVDAPEPLQKMLETHLDIARFRDRADLSDDQFLFMVETVSDQVRQLSATEGWFDPQTTVRVEGEGDGRVVYLSVDAGARTLIRNVQVDVTGPAATQAPEQVAQLRENWGLPPERPFRQEDWDKAKDDALVALQSKSYYGATLARSQARVEPDEQAADLLARYASGPAYTLGALQVTGTRRYPQQIISNVNPLAVGEPYRVERLLELQRAVQNQPYFANVQVELGEPVQTDVPDTVIAPVNVQVREYPTHRLSSGVGYTTDTGAQVEGRYSYLNMFNRAWIFDSQARIAQSRQYAFAELAMPPDSKTYRNSVYTSYDRTIDIESTDITSWRAGLKRSRTRERYDTTLSLDYYYDHLQPFGQPEQLSRALVPAYSWTRRDVDNPVFPRRGNVINTQVGVAMKGLLTDQTFFRAYGRIRQFIPVRNRDLIVARLELGADFTTGSAEKIPASLRFRAGGTDSIRGYGFQSIGTRQGASVLPAKYLGTASLEYQYWFKPDWGAAVFWDAGTATNNLDGVKLYHGVGVGARWRSPVGPVQLDVGYGIQESKIRPHISLGVAF